MKDIEDLSRMFAAVPYDIIKALENGNALALYAVLKMYAGANGDSHPSRKTLAKLLGYKSPRMVDLALDRLTELGLVKIIPRFKDEDGRISYKKTGDFKEQTSNGYVIYDQIRRQDQLVFPDPIDTGVHTPTHPCAHPLDTGVHTPYTPVLHEGDTPEGDTPEGDPPVVPQRGTGGDRGFGEFWDTYPRHVGKPKAVLAYARAVKRAGEDAVLEGVHRFATDPNLPTEKQYIPYPTTWLNRDGWEDDPLPARGGRQEDRKSDQILQAVVDLDRDRQEGGFSWQAISQ